MEQENKDEKYMRKALDEAQQAFDEGEIPIGAVVVCQDRIIARAHNLTETLHDVTAHAEMQAITAAANEAGRQVPHRLHALRHRRALHHVCRSLGMEPDTPHCLWLSRREAWLYRLCTSRLAS